MTFLQFLETQDACHPALDWVALQPDQSPRALWATCPDSSHMAWLLGMLSEHLPAECLTARRTWALACADRAVRIHAPSALTRAAACSPDESSKASLLAHAELLTGLSPLVDARAAAYAAADASDASDAAYAAAGAYAAP